MSDRSRIEWCDASWNPIRARNLATGKIGWHCVHASEGCRNCYAETFNRRLGTGLDYKPGNREAIDIFLDEKLLLQPLHWKRPRKIFVGSMTDIFAHFVTDDMLDKIFAVMALCPQHTLQVPTKRSTRMRRYFEAPNRESWINSKIWSVLGTRRGSKIKHGGNWRCQLPLPNVWIGVSCEDQKTADARILDLLATPAAKRFISAEPLLRPIDFDHILHERAEWLASLHRSDERSGLDWVICGGESGPHARPMHPDWARSLRDQCAAAGVPFFFKQWGEWGPDVCPAPSAKDRIFEGAGPCAKWNGDGWHVAKNGFVMPLEQDPIHDEWMYRVGKKAAGRLLDGIEHKAFPPL